MQTTRWPMLLPVDRSTLGRHALIVGILSIASVVWIGAANDSTKSGDVVVPAYYFPIEADTVEKYVEAKKVDCVGSSDGLALDYPAGWLKP